VGLGRLLAEGDLDQLARLRECAHDPRWRVREAVAMALQRWGDADMPALLNAMNEWAKGTLLERRAAVAAVCEPRLLKNPKHAKRVLRLLIRSQPRLCGDPIGKQKTSRHYGKRSAIAGVSRSLRYPSKVNLPWRNGSSI